MIQLLVKGNKFEAVRAAAAHNIPAAFYRELPRDTGTVETLLRVHDAHRKAVSDWFAEPGTAPFPAGALLFFRDLDAIEA